MNGISTERDASYGGLSKMARVLGLTSVSSSRMLKSIFSFKRTLE